MGVELLDKTRKINQLLHNNHKSKVVFNDICEVLTEILESNVLVISKKGKVLGSSEEVKTPGLNELVTGDVGEYIDKMLNERLLGILSTKENVNLSTLGFENKDSAEYSAIITPIDIAGERLGTIFFYRNERSYDIDDIIDIWRQNPDLDDHYRGPLDDLYAGNYTPEYLEQLKVLAQQLYGREQLNGMMILNDNVQTFRNISAHRLSGGINGNTRVANNSYQNRPILVASNGSSAGLFNREEREPNSLWFSLNHRWAKQDDHNKTNGYKYTPSTITIGYDRSLDNWLVGAALQYDDGKAKSNNSNRIEITSKDYLVGLYGGYHTDRWYVNGGLQYGTADNTSKSNFDFMGRTARTQGDYNINIWGANIETGIEYDVDGWNITPHIGLDYASIKQDEFTETGDRNFTRHFNSAKQNIIEIPVGVQLSKDFQLSNGFNLIPTLDLSYAFNAGDTDASTTANFTDVPHLPFLVKGLDRGRNIYRGKLGLSAQINSSLDISGSYGIELRDNFDSQFINLQLRYWF